MNNWFVLMHGVCLAVGNNWPRVYFLMFYFVAVNIALNTLVAVFLAITTGSEDSGATPVHTIAITTRQAEPIGQTGEVGARESLWHADCVDSERRSREGSSTTMPSTNRESEFLSETFTVQAFRRARSHSLLFEIMAST